MKKFFCLTMALLLALLLPVCSLAAALEEVPVDPATQVIPTLYLTGVNDVDAAESGKYMSITLYADGSAILIRDTDFAGGVWKETDDDKVLLTVDCETTVLEVVPGTANTQVRGADEEGNVYLFGYDVPVSADLPAFVPAADASAFEGHWAPVAVTFRQGKNIVTYAYDDLDAFLGADKEAYGLGAENLDLVVTDSCVKLLDVELGEFEFLDGRLYRYFGVESVEETELDEMELLWTEDGTVIYPYAPGTIFVHYRQI